MVYTGGEGLCLLWNKGDRSLGGAAAVVAFVQGNDGAVGGLGDSGAEGTLTGEVGGCKSVDQLSVDQVNLSFIEIMHGSTGIVRTSVLLPEVLRRRR